MSQMTLTANGTTWQAGTNPAEHCTTGFSMAAKVDDDGRFTHRPEVGIGRTRRQMLMGNGTLPLFSLILSSQRFNLLAKDVDKHPKAELLLDKQVGNAPFNLFKVVMEDVQPISWRLTWAGTGNDNLHGATFVESSTMTCSKGKVVNLADNSEAPFDLN